MMRGKEIGSAQRYVRLTPEQQERMRDDEYNVLSKMDD
jgi:hypothetical protein